jgi:hypothetical protein
MGWYSEGSAASSENNGLGSCQAHHVGGSPQEDRSGATSEMGEAEESSRCIETQAHHFSSRQEKDRGGYPCTMGGVPSSEEEGGLAVWD